MLARLAGPTEDSQLDVIETETKRGKTIVEIELWAALCVIALMFILVLLLWSAMRGRKVHLNISSIDTLREGLPFDRRRHPQGTLMEGNRVEILQNGDGFFPRLLADIAAATETIDLETYVWWEGDICRQVAAALAAKARG